MDLHSQAKNVVLAYLPHELSIVEKEAIAASVDQVLGLRMFAGSVDREKLIQEIQCLYSIFTEQYSVLDEGYRPWIKEKKAQIEWHFWNRYRNYLHVRKNFAPSVVDRLDNLTDDILDRLVDPSLPGPWDKRGMVVGQVQSGKTSNYSGLICKAIDAGYRFIVVLAGLQDSLRSQTQLRIDQSIVGFDTKMERNFNRANHWIGVGLLDRGLPVHSLTTSDLKGDFQKSAAETSGITIRSSDPIVLVVKKNTSILKNLIQWLAVRSDSMEDGKKIIADVPLLLIDDEADNASVNISKNSVSKTNAYIRALLSLFDRSAYVGYTATPFANIFIPVLDQEVVKGLDINIRDFIYSIGQDLFPRDFIINIKAPSNYVGPTKMFGLDGMNVEDGEVDQDYAPDVVKIIDDYQPFFSDKHKKDDLLPTDLPESLKTAIKCFILTCAARRARGQEVEHNSMLVHVTLYVRWQDAVAALVDRYLKSCQGMLEFGVGHLTKELRLLWQTEYAPVTQEVVARYGDQDPLIHECTWEEIERHLYPAAAKIEVRAVHGDKNIARLIHQNITPLDYYDRRENGLSVIAVGGNKLSRGLTLEGLSVSYYLRASKMYDTLMQMGRWFGYRAGYLDLCRLFTSSELVEWYTHITVASEEVRNEFDTMQLLNMTPREYGLKVRTHPGVLQITAANKLRSYEIMQLSYSDTLAETYTFSTNRQRLDHNFQVLEYFLSTLGKPGPIGAQPYCWRNVAGDLVLNFTENYRTDQRSIDSEKLSEYVRKQIKRGDLTRWTVVLISSNRGGGNLCPVNMNDQEVNIGMTLRTDSKKSNRHYILRKSHIISPSHESLDIPEEDSRYQEALEETRQRAYTKARESAKIDEYSAPDRPSGTYIRKKRGSENALLVLYILDPVGYESRTEKDNQPVVGYAISFPEIKGDDKVEYAVNEQFLVDEFDYPDEFDTDEEEDDS